MHLLSSPLLVCLVRPFFFLTLRYTALPRCRFLAVGALAEDANEEATAAYRECASAAPKLSGEELFLRPLGQAGTSPPGENDVFSSQLGET